MASSSTHLHYPLLSKSAVVFDHYSGWRQERILQAWRRQSGFLVDAFAVSAAFEIRCSVLQTFSLVWRDRHEILVLRSTLVWRYARNDQLLPDLQK